MLWKTAEYSGWGRVIKAKGDIARPEKAEALKALWKDNKAPAIGNLRSYGDAALNNKGKAIDMTRLDRLLSFDAATGILEAEAGITIGEIARIFAPLGWIPAVLPGTGFATLGGCICNDVHGKNHHVVGSFGQHVLSLDLLGANGRTRKITPDAAPNLFRATIGGLGQTGVILSAVIQMIPVGTDVMAVRESRADNLTEFMSMFDQSQATYSVGWIDATATGDELGRGILEEAEIKDHTPPLKIRTSKSVPKDAPKFLLSAPFVRAFNYFYLRRVPHEGRRLDRHMQDFFFPLDKVYNWNRLYGKPGFHQFQCVLPDATARETLSLMLESIANSRLASPLAVLKRLGDGRAGDMSFPMEGYTLAVDFPNRVNTASLLDDLEEMTLNAGGRIYLAKDSCAHGRNIRAMYDKWSDFAAIANEVDPKRIFETDMIRRLKLRGAK